MAGIVLTPFSTITEGPNGIAPLRIHRGQQHILGNEPGSDILVPSACRVAIEVSEGFVFVEDLESPSGTWIQTAPNATGDGFRLKTRAKYQLLPGNVLRLGDVRYVVREGGAGDAGDADDASALHNGGGHSETHPADPASPSLLGDSEADADEFDAMDAIPEEAVEVANNLPGDLLRDEIAPAASQQAPRAPAPALANDADDATDLSDATDITEVGDSAPDVASVNAPRQDEHAIADATQVFQSPPASPILATHARPGAHVPPTAAAFESTQLYQSPPHHTDTVADDARMDATQGVDHLASRTPRGRVNFEATQIYHSPSPNNNEREGVVSRSASPAMFEATQVYSPPADAAAADAHGNAEATQVYRSPPNNDGRPRSTAPGRLSVGDSTLAYGFDTPLHVGQSAADATLEVDSRRVSMANDEATQVFEDALNSPTFPPMGRTARDHNGGIDREESIATDRRQISATDISAHPRVTSASGGSSEGSVAPPVVPSRPPAALDPLAMLFGGVTRSAPAAPLAAPLAPVVNPLAETAQPETAHGIASQRSVEEELNTQASIVPDSQSQHDPLPSANTAYVDEHSERAASQSQHVPTQHLSQHASDLALSAHAAEPLTGEQVASAHVTNAEGSDGDDSSDATDDGRGDSARDAAAAPLSPPAALTTEAVVPAVHDVPSTVQEVSATPVTTVEAVAADTARAADGAAALTEATESESAVDGTQSQHAKSGPSKRAVASRDGTPTAASAAESDSKRPSRKGRSVSETRDADAPQSQGGRSTRSASASAKSSSGRALSEDTVAMPTTEEVAVHAPQPGAVSDVAAASVDASDGPAVVAASQKSSSMAVRPSRKRGRRESGDGDGPANDISPEKREEEDGAVAQSQASVAVSEAAGGRPAKAARTQTARGRRAPPVEVSESAVEATTIAATPAAPAKSGRGARPSGVHVTSGTPAETAHDAAKTPARNSKRKAVADDDEGASSAATTTTNTATPKPKRAAVAKPLVAFTGFLDDKRTKIVERLGGTFTTALGEHDGERDRMHLVTEKVRRTVKFLSALCTCSNIVTLEWLDACAEAQHFVDAAPYALVDKESEAKFGFKLADSLRRAATKKLLDGVLVHVTKSVKPDPKEMAEIVRCAGGILLDVMPTVVRVKSGDVIVVSCEDDKKDCKKLIDAGAPVYSAELLLSGVLRQTLDLAAHRLHGDAPADVDEEKEGKGKGRRR